MKKICALFFLVGVFAARSQDIFCDNAWLAPAPATGGGGSGPTFLTAVGVAAGSNSTTSSVSVTNAASIGNLVCVAVYASAEQGDVSSVTDSKGNTYLFATNSLNSNNGIYVWIYYSFLTSALTTSDTITATWASPYYCYRAMSAAAFSGATTFDAAASANGNGSSVSVPGSVAANSIIFDAFCGSSYTGTGFAGILQSGDPGNGLFTWLLYQPMPAGGYADPGGDTTVFAGWAGAWASFK